VFVVIDSATLRTVMKHHLEAFSKLTIRDSVKAHPTPV